jgi:hypothetical protein
MPAVSKRNQCVQRRSRQMNVETEREREREREKEKKKSREMRARLACNAPDIWSAGFGFEPQDRTLVQCVRK